MARPQPRLLVVVKGYPRVSETFVAQELLGLQQAGLSFEIVSLRQPYDDFDHPVHRQITAPVRYLPEELRWETGRVLRSLGKLLFQSGFWRAFRQFLPDLVRDLSTVRLRSFGQAIVLAAETPPDGPLWLYAHFAHTPTSVARYAATMLGAPFSISAHAKDIWTSPDWDLQAKLGEARWTVTCTASGRDHLAGLAPEAAVHLNYHGLDLSRFPAPPARHDARDGSAAVDPVRLISVGRAVPKKGYDVLLEALASLPGDLHWRFAHIGGGTELPALRAQADALGLNARIDWHGPRDQAKVLAAYRAADIFTLASHATKDHDRDGLPNVIVEAASQRLACVATDFSGIPELLQHAVSGLLVPPKDAEALRDALERAITDPALRAELGTAAEARVRAEFDAEPGIRRLKTLFEEAWRAE